MTAKSKCAPIIRWVGGKSKLADKIIGKFPSHTCYVEPFAGGAAVFLRKKPSRCEVINDINGDLINLYRCIQNHPGEMARQSSLMLHSRELFNRYKQLDKQQLTDIQRAARFYSMQRMAFGGKVAGQNFGYARTSKAGLSSRRFERDIAMLTERLQGVFIENDHWAEMIRRYDSSGTLFFCDPPYWETAGYGVEFDFDNYTKMAELMASIKGKMLVTVNDIPEMREVFAGFKIETADIAYSLHTTPGDSRNKSSELIISNY